MIEGVISRARKARGAVIPGPIDPSFFNSDHRGIKPVTANFVPGPGGAADGMSALGRIRL
jgi:hypothetical protein